MTIHTVWRAFALDEGRGVLVGPATGEPWWSRRKRGKDGAGLSLLPEREDVAACLLRGEQFRNMLCEVKGHVDDTPPAAVIARCHSVSPLRSDYQFRPNGLLARRVTISQLETHAELEPLADALRRRYRVDVIVSEMDFEEWLVDAAGGWPDDGSCWGCYGRRPGPICFRCVYMGAVPRSAAEGMLSSSCSLVSEKGNPA